eukprot:5285669-Pyramimonas_sp.AAC.3
MKKCSQVLPVASNSTNALYHEKQCSPTAPRQSFSAALQVQRAPRSCTTRSNVQNGRGRGTVWTALWRGAGNDLTYLHTKSVL